MSEVLDSQDSVDPAVDADGITVDTAVSVYPGTASEQHGIVVEDFGEMAGHAVDIGANHFADPARRYAVSLDSGELIFVDAHSVTAR